MKGRQLLLIVPIITMLMVSVAPLGYASGGGYTATTASTGNEISFSYFTISLYLKDDQGNYNPVTVSSLNNATYLYNSDSSGNKTLSNDTYVISSDKLYLKITENNVTYTSAHIYNLSSGVILKDSQGNPLTGITSSITAKDGSDNTVTDLSPDTYYKISVSVTINNSSQFTGDTLTQDASVTATINNSMNGSSLENTSVQVSIISIITPGFTPTDTPSGRTEDYGDHDSMTIVNEDNPGGVASPDGHLTLVFKVPAGKKFVIRPIANGEKSYFLINMTIDGTVYTEHPVTVNGNGEGGTPYVYKSGTKTMSHTNHLSDITAARWFSGQDVTVTITNRGDAYLVNPSAQLDIIFG